MGIEIGAMEWQSVLSRQIVVEQCLDDCLAQLRVDAPPDLVVVFAASSFRHELEGLPKRIHHALRPRVLLGCTGGGVIGQAEEVEQSPALSLTVGWLPEVDLHPFHLDEQELPNPDAPPERWHELLGVSGQDEPHFLLLADPFSFDLDPLLRGLDYAFPRSRKLGGLASDARAPGGNRLLLDHQIYSQGLVGVALSGNLQVDALVSQGCRPVGQAYTVTRGERNVILELDGRPPLECLEEMLRALNPRERRLAESSLFLGIRSPDLEALLRGRASSPDESLIRNLIGVDPRRHGLVVGAPIRPGQSVQFHLRDARSSAQELQQLLQRYASAGKSPRGGLLFSCLGRGEYLYGQSNHDSNMFQESFPGVALGGFFCNGEIGPVGQSTHLHGYTSCFALFREP